MPTALRCLATLALAAAACSPVRSSAVPTTAWRLAPHRGPVAVSATRDPAEGVLLGTVEASGPSTIDEVLPEFVSRVAQLGGDFARVDEVRTRFEWVQRPVMQQYNCGSFRFPMMCTRQFMQSDEVATLLVRGRAFRVGAAR